MQFKVNIRLGNKVPTPVCMCLHYLGVFTDAVEIICSINFFLVHHIHQLSFIPQLDSATACLCT